MNTPESNTGIVKFRKVYSKIALSSLRNSTAETICIAKDGKTCTINDFPQGSKLMRKKKWFVAERENDIPLSLEISKTSEKKSEQEWLTMAHESFARMIVTFFVNSAIDEYYFNGVKAIAESDIFEQAQMLLKEVYKSRTCITPYAEIDMDK